MQTRRCAALAIPIQPRTSKVITRLPFPLTMLAIAIAIAIACIYPGAALALPQNPSVTSGAVSISTADRAMQINQTTNKAIIDWQKFGIGFNESVTFNQPSRSSVVLNRVTGAEFSTLDGMLNATGQVFIINPNGVLIGANARMTVGGLLASTLEIDNQRFLNSDYMFAARSGSGSTPVTNAGTINAIDGGYVVMLSNNVRNNGTIDVPSGHVLMGAGSQATLYLGDQSLLGYRIDAGSAAALVDNGNTIRANGGQVTLAARGLSGASQLASAAVNNSGIIEARTLKGQRGAIVLSADMQSGKVSVTGKLDASAQTGAGGTIDTSAAVVSIGSTASVSTGSVSGKTGLWTITSGSPVIGLDQDSISNTVLNSTLDNSNITVIASEGDAAKSGTLSVDGAIAAQGKNKLVLTAAHDLLINAPVSVGSGGLVAFAGSKGTGEGKVIVARDARVSAGDGGPIDIYTNVSDYKDTSGYDGFITSPYRLWMLVNNVRQLQDMETNLSGNYALGRDIDAAETASWNGGAGFAPIGHSFGREFKGILDGQNHIISSLVINRPGSNYLGLFGMSEGEIKNLGLVDAKVTGAYDVGTFAGTNSGKLDNVYATGEIQAVLGGGLVGANGQGFNGTGSIRNAYSAVNMRGDGQFGGIAGFNAGTISDVYATGKVFPSPPPFPDINTTVWGPSGGIVGHNYFGGIISNAYWTTDGTGQSAIAGQTNGMIDAASLAGGLTTETIKTAPLNLDFNTSWFRYDGRTAPLLKSFLKPLSISAASRHIDRVYDGTDIDLQQQLVFSNPDAVSSQHLISTGNAGMHQDKPDAGTYHNTSPIEFWSDQRGYLIQKPAVNQNITVTISARPITVEASSDSKLFDSTDASLSSPGVSTARNERNLGLANGDTLNASQAFDSNEIGDRRLIISSLDIRNSAGRDVTSNYRVSRLDTAGKILAAKDVTALPDPGSEPSPKPNPIPDLSPTPDPAPIRRSGTEPDTALAPTPAPVAGSKPPTDQADGGVQSGAVDAPGSPVAGKHPAGAASGFADGRQLPPVENAGEQQQKARLFAVLGMPNEDELMEKRSNKNKLRNATTLSIQDGGIRVPDGIARQN